MLLQRNPLSPKTVCLVITLTCLMGVASLTSLLLNQANGPALGSHPSTNSLQQAQLKAAYGQLPLSFEINRGQTDPSVKYLARGSGYSLFLNPGEAVLSLSTTSSTVIQKEAQGASGIVQRGSADPGDTTTHAVVRMKVRGANTEARISGEDELKSKSNYFLGKDPQKWQRGISNFAKVRYQGVYPGIDLVYYGNQRQLEYDFVIQPGSDPKQIALAFEGADKISVDDKGELTLCVGSRELRQHRPLVYQDINGSRQEIASRYLLAGNNDIRFELGNYDVTKPLVIDPVLVYSTYFGGLGNENATSIAVNSAGEAFITGTAPSLGFPGTPLQGASAAGGDAYVVKLNAASTAVVYASYFGGDNADNSNAIAVDQSGNVYVAGSTQSFNFPLAGTPYQATKRGGLQMSKTADGGATYTAPSLAGLTTSSISGVAVHPTDPNTMIVSSFGGQGIYKTTDGGANWVSIRGTIPDTFNNAVAIDPNNPQNMYLAACQPGGIYRSSNGGNTWSATSVSGTCMNTVIADPSGVIYAGGFDGQGLHKSTDGGQTWNPYPVGANFDSVASLALDPSNPTIVYAGTSAGVYKSVDGGVNWSITGLSTGEAFDDSLAVDPNNPQIVYTVNSSQLKVTTDGGATWNTITNLGLSAGGIPTALLTVPTNPSTVFVGSTTNGVLKSTDNGATWSSANISTDDVASMAFAPSSIGTIYFGLVSGSDAFVTKLDPSGSSLVYSTYLGGGTASDRGTKDDNALAIAVDASGNAFVGGSTDTTDFPTQNGLQPFGGQIDTFLAKLDPNGSNLMFSTNFGGVGFDVLRSITLGSGGSVFVAGRTDGGIPIVNAAQSVFGGAPDAFLMRLNPSGNSYSIAYSTYLGGAGQDLAHSVAVDASNNAYIAGQSSTAGLATAGAAQVTKGTAIDGFLAKFDQNGAETYFTYIGGGGPGSSTASMDVATGVAVDSTGNAYVGGYTRSSGFPVNNSLKPFNATMCGTLPCLDAFVTKINSTGSARLFSTLLGGNADDQIFGIAKDSNGALYVAGTTTSTEFKAGAIQGANGGGSDAFVTKLASVIDLSVTMSDSPDPVSINNNVTYTATITNGEANVTGVTLTDPLPANTNYISASSSQGTCSGTSTVTCNIGSMAAGASVTVTITLTPSVEGSISNRVDVAAAESDTNPVNNFVTQTTNVTIGTVYTVNSTADTNDGACTTAAGGCTLREAMFAANNNSGKDTIAFNIPGAGAKTINTTSGLPNITEAVFIDGTSQPGFAGALIIELKGSGAGQVSGLNIAGGSSRIKALAINGFFYAGISLQGSNNVIEGCFIGTNLSGTAAVPNSTGISVDSGSNNFIGGTTPAARNVISGNNASGISVNAGATGTKIKGNYLGPRNDGIGALTQPNWSPGIGLYSTSGNIIGGTEPGARNVISGNKGPGISISMSYPSGPGSTNNLVQGNYVGTTPDGLGALINEGGGISINSGSSNNTIGGITSPARNVIANGVNLDTNANANNIQGNYIGIKPDGSARIISTGWAGVQVRGCSGNHIGGDVAGAGNVISGNAGPGIWIVDTCTECNPSQAYIASTNNFVQGNIIGLNPSGTAAIANNNNGIGIERGSTGNLIGGTTPLARNIISGNAGSGININNFEAPANGNTIQGNYIGTNAAGTAAIGNNAPGISVNGVSNNVIGGTAPGAGNTISGNLGDGITLNPSSPGPNQPLVVSSGNTIQGNLVGGSALLKNGNNGISLNGAANSLIGGIGAGTGNTIAFNNNNGVVVNCPVVNGVVTCGVGNQILSNSIYSHNNNRGIRLNSNGVNFGNNNQAAPALFFVGVTGGSANIAGKLTSTANSNYRIQVFSNDNCNPTGAGEGQRLIGTTTTASDGSGVATFSVSGPTQIGEFITATATNTTTNNTSQFSTCVQAAASQPGVLQFSLPSFAVSEGVGNALITVARSGDNSLAATVNYATTDNSAIAGSDYTATSGILSLAPGETLKTFVVPILNDGAVEALETLNLALSSPSSGSSLGTQATATLSIVDNDPAPQTGNNGKIAFGRRINNGLAELFVMDQDGSNAVNVTNNAADDQQPSWSPDGTKLAFMSNRNLGLYQVYTMNADGTNIVQLSDNSVNHYTPTWSPDGTKILFESDDTDLYVINADGTNLVRLTNTPDLEANTDWSPDGTKILYTKAPGAISTYELYVINADGTNPLQLTNNAFYDDWGQWSPDGSKIVFQTNRGSLNSEVYVMNADGSNPANLSNTEASENTPSWSSDGTKIAFTSNRDGNPEVYSMNADGSGATRLTITPSDSESFARWQPVEQKQNQTITFNPLTNRVYGDAPFTLSASASSNLAVTFSVISGPASIAGNTLTMAGVGVVTVRATQAGDNTYNSATADQSFTVAPVLLRVIADSKTKVYGAPNPTLTVHYSGFVNGEGTNVLGGGLSLNTAANTNSAVGGYAITPSGYTSNNYAIQYLAGTLTIDQASTSTASDNYSLIVPGNVNLVAQVTPNAPSTLAVNGGTVTFTIRQGAATIATLTSGPVAGGQASASFSVSSSGAYTVYASYSGDGNHFGSTGLASLTVGNANPVPSITGVTPDSSVKKPTETGQFTLFIDGNGFMATVNGDPANSTVDWYDRTTGQHTNLTLASITPAQIQAVVPFTLIRDGKTVEVSVNNIGPGGGTSNVQPFFVTDTTATVTSAETVIPDPATGTASTTSVTPTGAVLTAEASSGGAAGSGTLTVAQYSADPIGTNASPNTSAFSTAEGSGYFDVYVAPGSSFTTLSLDYCNTGGTTLYWWNGSVWGLVSNQTYNPVTGCITITVSSTSSPSIAQLTGTVFGVASGPAIDTITVGPSSTLALGSGPITLNSHFTDVNGTGPYTAEINWGDEQTSNLSVATGPGLTSTHAYTVAGTYSIKVKVSRGSSFGSSTFAPVVIYDPSAGFLTGGGWFNSPLGASVANPGFSGKVNFETSVKYDAGVPQGMTKVSLPGINFSATSFSWLSIVGSQVQVGGIGTNNGSGNYGFLLSGIDGKLNGKKMPDKIRVKIWNRANGQVIYDSQLEAADSVAPVLVLGGGNITIHK